MDMLQVIEYPSNQMVK